MLPLNSWIILYLKKVPAKAFEKFDFTYYNWKSCSNGGDPFYVIVSK